MKTFSVSEFLSYVNGWLSSYVIEKDELTMANMKTALIHSLEMIEDGQDGIEADIERAKADASA